LNRSRVVSHKKMTLMERIYLPAMVGGLFITIKHFFRLKRPRSNTRKQKRPISDLPWPARAEARRAGPRALHGLRALCAVSLPGGSHHHGER
jgi:NADH-quinone oxidoreductase subunit I